MREELARVKLPLATLVALLLFVDAGVVWQLYLNGLPLGWMGSERGRVPASFTLMVMVIIAFFAAIHLGVGWLFWQLYKSRKSGSSRLLHRLLGDEPVIASESDFQDFRFKSRIDVAIFRKICAFVLIWASADFVKGWLHPSWKSFPFLILGSPIPIFLWAAAALLLFCFCEIEVLDGQLRFRHFVRWRSVPVESISGVSPRWIGVYVSVDHGDRRCGFFFDPQDYRVGPSPPPIVQFLQVACRRNSEGPHKCG